MQFIRMQAILPLGPHMLLSQLARVPVSPFPPPLVHVHARARFGRRGANDQKRNSCRPTDQSHRRSEIRRNGHRVHTSTCLLYLVFPFLLFLSTTPAFTPITQQHSHPFDLQHSSPLLFLVYHLCCPFSLIEPGMLGLGSSVGSAATL